MHLTVGLIYFNTHIGYYLYQYFVKVVGTKFVHLNGTQISTNQFSVTENERDISPKGLGSAVGIPGISFKCSI